MLKGKQRFFDAALLHSIYYFLISLSLSSSLYLKYKDGLNNGMNMAPAADSHFRVCHQSNKLDLVFFSKLLNNIIPVLM